MKWFKRSVAVLFLLIVGSVWAATSEGYDMKSDWRTASRESAGIAPDPLISREAIVQVYAARAFSWRGYLGVHTWIASKRKNADSYRVYEVIGWRLYHDQPVVSVSENLPDRKWFGAQPEVLFDRRGEGVETLIDHIESAVKRYPYANEYTLWPGPNSNTFTAFVAREVPELNVDLPPTAIGKDYLGMGVVGRAPSSTGYQVSLFGLLGVLVAVEEGLEVNILGLTFGLDPKDIALKLPGVGRLSPIAN